MNVSILDELTTGQTNSEQVLFTLYFADNLPDLISPV